MGKGVARLPWRRCNTIALLAAAFGWIAWLGCGDDDALIDPVTARPEVVSSSLAANPNNAISAIVTTSTISAARVRVVIEADGAQVDQTPNFAVTSKTTQVPVLGLQPETDYTLWVAAFSVSGRIAAGDRMPFRTGALPTSITSFEVVTSGGSEPGFTLLAPIFDIGHPAVIVDSKGRVVWYRETPTGVVDFQLQPNGHYTGAVPVPASEPFFPAVYEEWDELGNLIRTWTTPGFELTDSHDIRLTADGTEALLLAYEARTSDLTSVGGPSSATVIGNVLQRVTTGGGVSFEWDAFDHYELEDADDFVWTSPAAGGFDFTHANAIEVEADGDYLLSTRHLSEITKIDAQTGQIVWRMGGGKANQFTFLNDPRNGFTSMHAVRRLPNGNLILVDNGNLHNPPSSRAVEYEVNEAARTATLVWSFEPGVFSCCMGSVQRLPGGNTLIALGQDYRVFEVSPSERVVWELRVADRRAELFGIYRAFRIPSLYVGI
jgi:hypothetical protein